MLSKFKLILYISVLLTFLNACSVKDKNLEPDPMDLIQSLSLQTEKLIIVTLDGVRWQEVFKGVDSYILNNNVEATENRKEIINRFGIHSEEQSRRNLMPFIWKIVAQKGQIYGNRNFANKVNVSNPYWYSYPGYNEIFTGKVNLNINNNSFGLSPDTNIFDFIATQENNQQKKIFALTYWSKFNEILNNENNNFVLYTNYKGGGNTPSFSDDQSEKIKQEVTSLFSDQDNHRYILSDKKLYIDAKILLNKFSPKVMYLSFGATDTFGHENQYFSYLKSIHSVNVLLEDLWDFVQKNEDFKDKTTLLITTDHGRGFEDNWHNHGSRIKGSNETWFAVIGPDTKIKGEMKERGQWYQKQLASFFIKVLGYSS